MPPSVPPSCHNSLGGGGAASSLTPGAHRGFVGGSLGVEIPLVGARKTKMSGETWYEVATEPRNWSITRRVTRTRMLFGSALTVGFIIAASLRGCSPIANSTTQSA